MIVAEAVAPGAHAGSPLLVQFAQVESRIENFRENVKSFFFDVVLSPYSCPICVGKLGTREDGVACESCGAALDPTVEFQRSLCCGARLRKRTHHYACLRCGDFVPSRFLFDERVFDLEYFRERMRDARKRKRQSVEALRELIPALRSETLQLGEMPDDATVASLYEALDAFGRAPQMCPVDDMSEFDLAAYSEAILGCLDGASVRFDGFPRLCEDERPIGRGASWLSYTWSTSGRFI